tara:strand:+ start:617 stop:1483 length:867 start_codon:yes stop_codon:yes gene_type:complete
MHKFLWVWLLVFSSNLSAEPLFWSAKKGNLEYLLIGSVHVGDDSMFPLPKSISQYLNASQALIVEADMRNPHGLTYPPLDVTSKDVLNAQQQQDLIGIANLLQLNQSDLLNSPPWAAALAIQMQQIQYLGYRPEDGVDMRLLNSATTKNIPVIGLESLQFQVDLLTSQQKGGAELLTSAIEQFDHNENAMHCLIESWKKGDITKLNQFAKLTEMSPEFEQAFLTKRNNDWVNKLSNPKWLPNKKGKYLVVVGTLHLIGDQSVIHKLSEKGFRVKQLSESKSANCEFKY